MSRVVQERLDALLDAAEGEGVCLVPSNRSDRDALLRRRSNGRVVSPYRGAFVRAETWRGLSPIERALVVMRTVSSLHPDWAFCHSSAAVVHGLEVSYGEIGVTHVLSSCTSHSSSSRTFVRHASDCERVVTVDGVRVTAFWDTVFDCLATLGFPRALAIADSALRGSGLSREEAMGLFRERFKGRRHMGRVLDVLSWADGRSENGGESAARAAMIELGLELPELQVEYPDPMEPGHVFRVDFVWYSGEGWPIFGELDGMVKYTDERILEGRTAFEKKGEEQERSDRLSAYRAVMVRFTMREVADRDRFARKLEAKGVRRGHPPTLSGGIPLREGR